MSSRSKSEKGLSKFPSFNIIPSSLNAHVQSHEPLVQNRFEFAPGNPVEHVHETLEKFVFIL
jgi:hypothetical protein